MGSSFADIFLLVLTSNLLYQEIFYYLSRHGSRLGLTSNELLVLLIISLSPMTIADISKFMGIDKTTVEELIKTLKNDNLVQVVWTIDSKCSTTRLTDKGKMLIDRLCCNQQNGDFCQFEGLDSQIIHVLIKDIFGLVGEPKSYALSELMAKLGYSL